MSKLTPEQVAEHRREAGRRWRAKNPDKVREANRRRKATHPEENRKAMRRWRTKPENAKKNRKAMDRWAAENPDRVRALGAANSSRRRAAKAGVPFSRDRAVTDFYEMAGSAASAPCTYCGIDPGPGNRQVDHKIPRARGGPHSIENLAVACGKCNRDKGTMTPDEYLASQGYKTKSSTTR